MERDLSQQAAASAPRISLKVVALPAEHGGWGFLSEPLLLGLLVAPSWAGVGLLLAAVGIFLIHQPLKLTLKDYRRGRRFNRTRWAERFAVGYMVLAVTGFVLAVSAAQASFWLPLLIAAPLAAIQFYYELQNWGRETIAEAAGAVALGAFAPAMVLANAGSLTLGMILWLVLTIRAVASILYVRARLRLEYGREAEVWPVIAAHIVGVVAVSVLAAYGLITWLVVLPLAVLLARSVKGLSSYRKPVKPRTVGFGEMGYGLLTVVSIALGYHLGI